MIKTEYSLIGPKEMTIALAADLHQLPGEEALKIIRETEPDVIAVPGDLLERKKDWRRFSSQRRALKYPSDGVYEFLRQANRIAPVVYSLGNHEQYLTEKDREVLRETGTILLQNEAAEIKGVLFGGIPSRKAGPMDMAFLKSFGKREEYKVLLCHHPEYYPLAGKYADLILSGHCHGGQIRAFGHGIFSPGQGIFPKYHHGLYHGNMIVSAGCANTSVVPRWGNPEEVVVIHIYKNRS